MTTQELYVYLRLAEGANLVRQPSGINRALVEREWKSRSADEQAAAMETLRGWMEDGC